MPRYDYVCDTCGEEVEQNRPVDERADERRHLCSVEGDMAIAGTLKRRWAPTPFLGVHIFGSARAPRNRV